MFWIKTIKKMDYRQKGQAQFSMDLQKQIKECENKINYLKDHIKGLIENDESYEEKFIKIDKDIEAISAVLASDRKDINALIQLIKKSTKGRK